MRSRPAPGEEQPLHSDEIQQKRNAYVNPKHLPETRCYNV